jgi:hypothetical protein
VATALSAALAVAALTPPVAHGAAPLEADAAASPLIAAAAQGRVIPPDIQDVEHMCALLTSCDKLPIPPVASDFAACVRKMTQEMTSPAALSFSLTLRECGLKANSCAELRTCALRGAKPDACKGRGKNGATGVCDIDGRAITCWNEQVLAVRDCPRGGELCAVRDGEALCTLGPCEAGQDTAAPSCSRSGTRILRCDKGKLVSLDCATFGLVCAPGGDGAACVPATSRCNGSTTRCDGNQAVSCHNGREARVDCGAAGLSCTAAPGAIAIGTCHAPPPPGGGSGCDANAPARCDGASLKYCFAGKTRSYLCKALGFNRCASSPKGGARCAN